MAAEFICDGCGRRVGGVYYRGSGGWSSPTSWYEHTDKETGRPYVACSRQCIEKIARETGATGLVLPV